MNSCYILLMNSFFIVLITADINQVRMLHVQEDERVRLECILTSKTDAEEAMWMRIRPPHNPDILTYRDSVVYAPDRLELDQRRLSSSMNSNGTLVDTYFLILIITKANLDDEGRYICAKGRHVFAEYDLFIIVPPRILAEKNFIPQQTLIEGSTLHLSCSAVGRPMPWITWFYRTNNSKLVLLGDGTGCRETVCEIYLGNYTRHDPTIIECIADNEKSSRISKRFNIDILYPPKIITNVRTLTGSKSIDIFLECSSMANPSPTISWFDDNQQEINDYQYYTIKIVNHTSILSFSIYSNEHSKVLYYCRSNNSVGIAEKLINISDFIQFDNKPPTMPLTTISPSRKPKSGYSNHIQSKSIITTTIASNSSASCYSTILFFIFLLCHFIKS